MRCSAREGGLGATSSSKAGRPETWLTQDTDPEQGEQSKTRDSSPVQPRVQQPGESTVMRQTQGQDRNSSQQVRTRISEVHGQAQQLRQGPR